MNRSSEQQVIMITVAYADVGGSMKEAVLRLDFRQIERESLGPFPAPGNPSRLVFLNFQTAKESATDKR